MITANFSAYSKYVTDSLNQWDLNRTLQVTGLNLTAAPEVHFSNANVDRAIVRQASMANQVVTVSIPNSLLQDPLRIKAHIGVYEGGEFKVVELVEIPVKARKRPQDYQIEDTDGEVYSFNRLENEIAQMATKTQVANIVANANSTEGNSELVDIRAGENGAVYPSAGEAVRMQLAEKASRRDVEQVKELIKYDYQYLNKDERVTGEYWNGNAVGAAAGYTRYPVITGLPAGTYFWGFLSLNFTVFEDIASGALHKLSEYTTGSSIITIPFAFNLYATTANTADAGLFGSGSLPDEYLLGAYNVDYKNDAPHVFHCGPNREYTKLKDAIEAAEEFMDALLYVDRAEYDLVTEFGADFFAKYTANDVDGIVLKNRIHIIFEQGSKVICKYTGGNANVHEYFSPFNAGPHGFTLENAWVESTNTRYAMHDELSGSTTPNRNIYKRCTFIHDSSGTSWGAHQALGGGLGSWGDILIEDCFMSAAGCDEVLTYHNAGYGNPDLTDYASHIVIRGCYIEGTIRVNSTGYSKRITYADISGNSLASEPMNGKTTTDAADNLIMRAWNNTIRS